MPLTTDLQIYLDGARQHLDEDPDDWAFRGGIYSDMLQDADDFDFAATQRWLANIKKAPKKIIVRDKTWWVFGSMRKLRSVQEDWALEFWPCLLPVRWYFRLSQELGPNLRHKTHLWVRGKDRERLERDLSRFLTMTVEAE